ncbi:MAG: hypothetical protein O2975_06530 [Proteobacteria bacterium]|nr:hypothetical protein [Pseudomonadota bacterium]
MTMGNATRTARFAFLLACVVFAFEAWAQAGTVRAVTGQPRAETTAGQRLTLRVGTTFTAGTSFETGAKELIELVLADGQVLIIGYGSRVRIERFRFDGESAGSNVLEVVLAQGSMRFIGGAIAVKQPRAVRVAAGASSVGIQRGGEVDFTLVVDTTADQAGVLAVARGEVSLTTPFGVIGTMTRNQVARWQARGAPGPVPLASLPAILQAQVAAIQTPQASGQAGTVRSVVGDVSAQTATGERVRPGVGMSFTEGTLFFTENDARVELVLSDGQIVMLGPKAIVRIDRFRFSVDATRDPGTSVLGVTVLNGLMRFAGGIIAANQPESVYVIAGDARLGVLREGGVDFTVGVGVTGEGTNALTVREGEITLTTRGGGTDNVPQGQGATWRDGGVASVLTSARMPPAILADLLSLIPSVSPVQALAALPAVVVSPGGGGGCVGSPC